MTGLRCPEREWRRSGDGSPAGGSLRGCEWPGCTCDGTHRAPRSREALHQYRWYCLDHVRIYNAAWNYYAGMSDAEVEADRRADVVWQRPSWPLGRDSHYKVKMRWPGDDDPSAADPAARCRPRQRPGTAMEQAMALMQLSPPLTVAVVKARYKQLVKQHHPDANHGDKDAEERFKQLGEAYRLVMASLT